MIQTLTIPDWFPAWNPNGTGNRSHWAALAKRKKADELMVWASAKHANWRKVEGKARLTIVFVYPRRVRLDTDNLYARVKGCVDGLKPWFRDDSTEWLDLHVTSEVQPGKKALVLTLEDIDQPSDERG